MGRSGRKEAQPAAGAEEADDSDQHQDVLLAATGEDLQQWAELNCRTVEEAVQELSASADGRTLRFPDIGVREVVPGLADLLQTDPAALRALDVSRNGLGPAKVAQLALALGRNSQLVRLDLSGSNIGGGSGMPDLVAGLERNRTLKELLLYNNGIGDRGCVPLARFLGSPACALEVLSLRNNVLGEHSGEAIADALRTNRTLRALDLWMNCVGDSGAQALADALKDNDSLRQLGLYFNGIGRAGGVALAQMLCVNGVLETFDMGRNDVGPDGGLELARAVETNARCRLRMLNLYGNGIGDAAAIALLRALVARSKDVQLRLLGLDRNALTDAAADAICEALTRCHIDTFNLKRNQLGAGLEAVARTLCERAAQLKVRHLVLLENGSSAHSVEQKARIGALTGALFVQALLQPTPLRSLDVRNNKCGSECEGLIRELLAIRGEDPLEARKQVILDALLPLPAAPQSRPSQAPRRRSKARGKEEAPRRVWTPRAFKMSSQNMYLFVLCLDTIAGMPAAVYPDSGKRLWDSARLWKTQEPRQLTPFIHHLFAQQRFELGPLVRFLEDQLDPRVMLRLFNSMDSRSRSLRSMVLTSNDLDARDWAGSFGTFLKRYQVDAGPPVHVSRTCVVCFATDVVAASHNLKLQGRQEEQQTSEPLEEPLLEARVALKIFKEERDLCRELEARGISAEALRASGDRVVEQNELDETQTPFVYTLGVLAVHWPQRCIVMRQADRTLFEVINTERIIASRDMRRVQRVAYQLANAVLELHEHKLVHGDVKPRNLLRVSRTSASRFFRSEGNEQKFDFARAWRDSGEAAAAREARSEGGSADEEDASADEESADAASSDEGSGSEDESDDGAPVQHAGGDAGAARRLAQRQLRRQRGRRKFHEAEAEEWMLIDMDAAATFGARLSHKCSTGYVPPEMARALFGAEAAEGPSPRGARKAGRKSQGQAAASAMPNAHPSFDVWSFGVVLYELLSGNSLFLVDKTTDSLVSAFDKAELVNWLVLDDERLARLSNRTSSARLGRDLVQKCLVGDPTKRISIAEVAAHPFIRRVEVARVRNENWRSMRSVPRDDLSSAGGDAAEETPDPAEAAAKPKKKSVFGKLFSRGAARKKPAPEAPGKGTGKTPGKAPGKAPQALPQSAAQAEELGGGATPHPRLGALVARSRRQPQGWPEGLREADLKAPFAPDLEHHFFLSHVQKEASAIAKDLWLNVRSKRCTAWLDVVADDLTLPGMEHGILTAQTFVFVLTRTALFRPYCIRELAFALKHAKPVIVVVERDPRFDAWNPAFVPWIASADDFRARFRAAADLPDDDAALSDAQADLLARRAREFAESKAMLEAGLDGRKEAAKLLKPVQEFFLKRAAAATLVYRRRYFETNALVTAMLRRAAITPPELVRREEEEAAGGGRASQAQQRHRAQEQQQLLAGFNSSLRRMHAMPGESWRAAPARRVRVLVVCCAGVSRDKAQDFCDILCEDGRNTARRHDGQLFAFQPTVDEGGALLREQLARESSRGGAGARSEATVAVLVLADGFFRRSPGLAADLADFWFAPSGPVRVAALQVERAWSWTEHQELASAKDARAQLLYSRLFIATEILFYREEFEHETEAMFEEVKKIFLKAMPT